MGAGGRQFIKSIDDRLQHPFKIDKRIVRPEAQYLKTLGTQESVASPVVAFLCLMLRSIEFDNQFRIETCEVGDVIPERMLPAKLHS